MPLKRCEDDSAEDKESRCHYSDNDGQCYSRWTTEHDWDGRIVTRLCDAHIGKLGELRPATPEQVRAAVIEIQRKLGTAYGS